MLKLQALCSVALAPLLVTLPSLAGTPPTGTVSTIKVVNNFANATDYFGVHPTDADVWIYMERSPVNLRYYNTDTTALTTILTGQSVQLSKVQDREFYAGYGAGTGNAHMYAVLFRGAFPANNCVTGLPTYPVPVSLPRFRGQVDYGL